MGAALCLELAGQKEGSEEMIAMVVDYRQCEDKTNWEKADRWAFKLAEQAKAGTWDPHLELFQLMTVKHRSTMFMPLAKQEELLGMLRVISDASADDPDRKCRSLFLQAEILRQAADWDRAISMCSEGLALQSSLSEDCARMGFVQYMHYIAASSHFYSSNLPMAKASLRKLEECTSSHDLYWTLQFKGTQLTRRLGIEMKDSYLEISVPNRSDLSVEANVPAGTNVVEWDFTLADFSISFSATFRAEGADGEVVQLQHVEKHEASNGPVSGRFEPSSAGKLKLTFDNRFSMMRSKEIVFRVLPETLILEGS